MAQFLVNYSRSHSLIQRSVSLKVSKRVQDKWLISDALWEEISSLIPTSMNFRPQGGGRSRTSDRDAMNGIFFVLKTGCQWRALDATYICSGATAHKRFKEWTEIGVFEGFWKRGLQRYNSAKGINWSWCSLDASNCKAPLAGSKKLQKTRKIGVDKA